MIRFALAIFLAFAATAQIPGTFRVTGPVAPPATNSNFGAALPVYNYGGLLTGLSSLSQLQDLNRYPLARRHAGQVARLTTGAEYTLGGDLTSWYNSGSVSNMAQLRSIESGVGGTVVVNSYWGDGKGGGFTAILTNSIVGTNLYGGMVLALGGTNSWLNQNPIFNVKEFGARGTSWVDSNDVINDAGDDQPYIQAAIDYCYTRDWPGGQVYVPNGGYILESTLLIQRLDEAQSRLGYTNMNAAVSNYWAPYARIILTGDGLGTTFIVKTNATHFGVTIEGKATYGDYKPAQT
jgi:hypothetical protein